MDNEMKKEEDDLVKKWKACFRVGDSKGLDEASRLIYGEYSKKVLDDVLHWIYYFKIDKELKPPSKYKLLKVLVGKRTEDKDKSEPVEKFEDLFNDVWVTIFDQLKKDTLKDIKIIYLRSWLRGLSRNIVHIKADEIYEDKRKRVDLSKIKDKGIEMSNDNVELDILLKKGLETRGRNRLSRKEYNALKSINIDKKTLEETAKEERVTVSAIRKRIAKAEEKFRNISRNGRN